MSISSFFIDRPIFAAVISVVMTVAGLVALPLLPISEYPEIVPPTVVVSGQYPGASPKTIAETVVTPLEQQINGVENMIYMSSSATPDGAFSITVTFRLGTNLDTAQVQTQNRVSQAATRLPQVVRQIGLVTQKRSPDLTMVVYLTSPDDRYDSLYLRNYAVIQVRDVLARLPGAGDVQVFGSGDYAMRLWLDPGKIAARGLTADDVLNAVREQNTEVATGRVGGQPALPGTDFSYILNARGRLETEEQFGEIIVKTGEAGDVVYLRDVARIELGPETYALRSMVDGKPAVGIGIFQLPGANALQLSASVRETMAQLATAFPRGLEYQALYDTTVFVRSSISAVVRTLVEAVALVVLVVIVFLQSWRASVIPLVAVPVAIVGSLAVLYVFGFSINSLTLFGLVLATGIVVDDAIVVVENVERKMEGGLSALAAAHSAMKEVTRPIVSIMLVLCAVFIPVAFLGGIEGQFYQQFAITVAASTVISTLNSLTLSPALAALLLKPRHTPADRLQRGLDRVFGRFFAWFNRTFSAVAGRYAQRLGSAIQHRRLALAAFCVLLLCTWIAFRLVPTGFIPAQDKQYLLAVVQLPDAASLDRTEAAMRQMSDIALKTPGVEHANAFPGLSANGFVSLDNAGVMFLTLSSFNERGSESLSADAIAQSLNAQFAGIADARILVVTPPPVQGLGTTGGFKLYVQDRAARGYSELAATVTEVIEQARRQPELSALATYTTFQNNVPQLYADVDRVKAKTQSVLLSDVFSSMQAYLGSTYVNDFNRFGRTFRVYAQADAPFRTSLDDVKELKTRNAFGEMTPLGSLVDVDLTTGPDRVAHYNVYLAADVNSQAAPGYSSGQATAAMERVLRNTLPNGFRYEWTELAYQQRSGSNVAPFVFGLSVLLVFLILAAQYESWSLPFAIVLIVPLCLLSALAGVWLVGSDRNILTQIAFIVLVGLACKNAILIVEFARELVRSGSSAIDAAIEASRLRLRPILMTSFAFIMGVVPLVVADGAGSEMRNSMGIAVFAGMLGVTLFGLLLTPVFFVVIEHLLGRKRSSVSIHAAPEIAEHA